MFKRLTNLFQRDLHPLNEAVVRLTKNKWYTFAEGKTSCASGEFRVVRLRSVNGEDVIDVEIRLRQDERKIKGVTTEQLEEAASKLKETYRQQQTQLINYLSNQPETASFYFRLLQLLPEAEYLVIANTLLDK